MTGWLKKLGKISKSAGVTRSHLTYEETLINGFNYSVWWKYKPRPTDGVEILQAFLLKIRVPFDDLLKLATARERSDLISSKLSEEREGLETWFELGSALFLTTWMLCEREGRDTETARAILQEPDVRRMSAVILDGLMKIGWSPDEAETFYIAKIVPFLYDEGLRKWMDSPHMAVMSDLRYKARQLDKTLKDDSDERRIAGYFRALIEAIPFIGKALAILIFGVKKGKD